MNFARNRILFFVFVSIVLALIFGAAIYSKNILMLCFIGILLLYAFVSMVCKKQIKPLICYFMIFCIMLGMFYVSLNNFYGKTYSGEVVVVATVDSTKQSGSFTFANLCKVNINGEKVSYGISLSIGGNGNLQVGDVIIFKSKLQNVDFESIGFYVRNKISKKASVKSFDVYVKDRSLSLSQYVRVELYDMLCEKIDKDTASLVCSVVLGDKTNLDNEVNNGFSQSGLGHLLAISGLHISVVIMLISFLIQKLKTKKVLHFVIMLALLMFYCMLCGFSPSVVRAATMCLCYIFVELVSRKKDKLNSLALSGILLLCINPLNMLDIGFILSYLCVFAIFCLYKPLFDFFVKCKFKKLSAVFALTLSVQFVIFPLTFCFYKSYNMFSILANIILVPFFQIVFMLTFPIIIIVAIFPFMSFLLMLLSLGYSSLSATASLIASFDFAYIRTIKFSYQFLLLYFVSLFFIGGFTKFKGKIKYGIISCLCFLTMIFVIMEILLH